MYFFKERPNNNNAQTRSLGKFYIAGAIGTRTDADYGSPISIFNIGNNYENIFKIYG